MENLNKLNEVFYNGNHSYIENGDFITILNEEITSNNGDMTVEQLREVLINEVTMTYNKKDNHHHLG